MRMSLHLLQVKENRLKHHVNELANENADLKVVVGRMRYKADETEPEQQAPSIIVQSVGFQYPWCKIGATKRDTIDLYDARGGGNFW